MINHILFSAYFFLFLLFIDLRILLNKKVIPRYINTHGSPSAQY